MVLLPLFRWSCLRQGCYYLHVRPQTLHRQLPNLAALQLRHKTSQKTQTNDEIDLDEPYKFSTSAAAKWKAGDTWRGTRPNQEDSLWYQPYVVHLCLFTLFIYFVFLREENELDYKLNLTLYDHIEGLEEKQLELSLIHAQETGGNTTALINRLAEIRKNKPVKPEPQS